MRILTIGVLTAVGFGCLSPAKAADLDYDLLRGAEYEPEPVVVPVIDWSGVYVGAHGGYTSPNLGQRNVFQSSLANYFRARDIESEFSISSLIALPGRHVSDASYGAFAGYNIQLDEIVLGVEADYTHFDRASSDVGKISRLYTTDAGMYEFVSLDGKSTTTIKDYGSFRGRVGYAIGNFLPFVTGGIAVGQIAINDTIAVQNYGYDARTYAANQAQTSGSPAYVYNHGYTSFNPAYPGNSSSPAGQVQTRPAPPNVLTAAASSNTVAGAALGAGLEYAITSNILLRGEYQYVWFNDFSGHKAELSTVRGGAAVKF